MHNNDHLHMNRTPTHGGALYPGSITQEPSGANHRTFLPAHGVRLINPGHESTPQHSKTAVDMWHSTSLHLRLNALLSQLQSEAMVTERAASSPVLRKAVALTEDSLHRRELKEATSKCPHCARTLSGHLPAVAAQHPSVCAYRPLKCQRCSEIVTARYAHDHAARCRK
eukprot:GILI01043549.1.p1 GENE.GILI01043549.1~~GILI01043549.1.p1  ORF type:complete len:169 (-),score=17.50 GILI01043549.1:56-562(-)